MVKKESNFTEQAQDVMKSQKAILESLAKLRSAEFRARMEMEKSKQGLVDITRIKMIELHNNPKFAGMVDPVTGKHNKEWTEIVMENEIQQDEEVVEMLGEFYKAQQTLGDAQTSMQIEIDRLGTTQGWLRVLAALISRAAGEEV